MHDPTAAFLSEIEKFLDRNDVAAWRFGKEAVGDPNLIGDLREGRSPSLRTVARVNAYMAAVEREPAA